MEGFSFSLFEILSTVCFFVAILHTFLVKKFQHQALKYEAGSVGENLFHLLGEIEVVFGFWAGIFILLTSFLVGKTETLEYLNQRNFIEPLFVFVIMTVCSTKPILFLVDALIFGVARILPLHRTYSVFISALVVGPLLGSFITEPAAMTVTALFLLKHFYEENISDRLKYATLGLLFVNISIGGTLTPYAAPPVLMVASSWGWDLSFMFTHFGWKALVATLISSVLVVLFFKNDFKEIKIKSSSPTEVRIPIWVSLLHLVFLALVILNLHNVVVFMGTFLFFMGVTTVTQEYQDQLKIKESLLVAFFLAGLVVLGGPQKWWLQPILSQLSSHVLYFGSMFLTAFTDNAALTYLGSQVENMEAISKYALVAGSVVGGGMTVIANAPNPAGFSILNASFGEEGISPLRLAKFALIPTVIAALLFLP